MLQLTSLGKGLAGLFIYCSKVKVFDLRSPHSPWGFEEKKMKVLSAIILIVIFCETVLKIPQTTQNINKAPHQSKTPRNTERRKNLIILVVLEIQLCRLSFVSSVSLAVFSSIYFYD